MAFWGSFKRRIESVANSVVTAIIMAGLAAVWTTLRVYAQDTGLGLPVAIGAGIMVFAGVVVAYHQLLQIRDRAQAKRLEDPTPSEIEDRITKWLLHYGDSVQTWGPPEGDFGLKASREQDIDVFIHNKPGSAMVVLTAFMRIADEHRPILKSRAPLFQYDIVPELYLLGAQSIPHFEDGELVHIRVFHQVIVDRSLKDLDFMQSVLLVRRGARLVLNKVQRVVKEEELRRSGDISEADGDPPALGKDPEGESL